jgi:DNA-directed RNA polymerase specialized sigma24 family protein
VESAVDLLQELDREILMMRQIEDRPYEEIALLLEIEPEAARHRLSRRFLLLRVFFEPRFDYMSLLNCATGITVTAKPLRDLATT